MWSRSFLVRWSVTGALVAAVGVAGIAYGGGLAGHVVDHVDVLEHLDTVAPDLGLTDDQRARVEDIGDRARSGIEALRPEHDQLVNDAIALFGAPTVDREAAEALRQRALGLVDQGTAVIVDAAVDVAEVLTPEQRAEVATKAGEIHADPSWHDRMRARLHGGR